MSVTLKIEIKNIRQIRKAFGKAPQIMGKELRLGIEKATRLINAYAKASVYSGYVIRRTGYLRASHETRFEGLGLRFSGIIEPRANYAMFLHEGTRYIRPRPWLKDALDKKTSDIDSILTQHTQKALDRIGKMT